MTLYVNEANLIVQFATNLPNLTNPTYGFVITSQYSHQPLVLTATVLETNDRYTLLSIPFPTGFGDSHKNGFYYYDIVDDETVLEAGLVKITTEPGGGNGAVAYEAGVITDERVSDVFFRPNY